jgi:aspartate/methionine/tyrosine aminotransferase
MIATETFEEPWGRAGTSHRHDFLGVRRREGQKIIATSGVPLWPPPAAVFNKAYERLMSARVVAPFRGFESLRAAIVKKREQFGARVSDDEVLITSGAKDATHLVLSALCSEGADVIVPSPNYPYYGNCAAIGARMHTVPEDVGTGRPGLDRLLAMIETIRPRVVMTSNPVNPTGHVWTSGDLKALVEACSRHGTWLVLDESFEELVKAPYRQVSGDLLRVDYPRIVTLHSFSKVYTLQWARVGYIIGPAELVHAAASLQEWSTLRVNAFSQYLAEEALKSESEGWLESTVQKSLNARGTVIDVLQGIDRITVAEGPALGSVFVYLGPEFGSANDTVAWLLDSFGIAAFPGDIFRASAPAVRIATIADSEIVSELCSALQAAFGSEGRKAARSAG